MKRRYNPEVVENKSLFQNRYDRQIRTILEKHYGITGAAVFPEKGGWAALAYKVVTSEHIYFLKVYDKGRSSTPRWTANIDQYAPICRWLTVHTDLKGKMPVPLMTRNGVFRCEDETGIYLLYDYIVGETIGDKDLTAKQIRQLSEIIATLHQYGQEIPLPNCAIKEDFAVPYLQQLRLLQETAGTLSRDVQDIVLPRLVAIGKLVAVISYLSDQLKNKNRKLSLCHTDIHNWNMMQAADQLVLIDWEGLRLAPVEADFIFLVDLPFYDCFMGVYHTNHPDFKIDADALNFYHIRRKLEDTWEFIERLLYDPQDQQDRAHTLRSLSEELDELDAFLPAADQYS